MSDIIQKLAQYVSEMNSTFARWGRLEFIAKNFCSGSIYISFDNIEDYADAAVAISDLQKLRLPSLEIISSSEQYKLFEAFLCALKPLDYLPYEVEQASLLPERLGYVEISQKNAHNFVTTAVLGGEQCDSSQSSIPYLEDVFECFASDAAFFVSTSGALTNLAFDAGIIVLEQSLKQLSVLCYVNDQRRLRSPHNKVSEDQLLIVIS